jgi:hypothetical protein
MSAYNKVKFTSHGGCDIYIDGYGNFSTEVNGIRRTADTFEKLKLAIEEERKAEVKTAKLALKCCAVVMQNEEYSVEQLILEGLNRTDGSLKWQGSDGSKVLFALPANQENSALAEEYAIAKTTLSRVEDLIRSRKVETPSWRGRISASDYPQRLKSLRDRYDSAVKAQVEMEKAS